jgi:cell division cycle protein 37
MPLNYSKWDNIELSDDEDNFHPNIDNNLMIRLQREKRQQREAEEAEKRKMLERELKEKGSKEAAEELEKLDRMQKLHVGNISKDRFSSTHEKSKPSSSAEPSKAPEAKVKVKSFEGETFTDGYEDFLAKNKPILLEYAAIDEDDEASEQFVLKHTQLLSEHATGFYLLHCINLQAEGKTREMRKTARQYLLLTYVVDLAKSMPGRDARDAIKPLFGKMLSNPAAAQSFEEHLDKYVAHVKTRAEVKKQEALAEADEDDSEYVPLKKGEHLGPGGLDPAEVFETLPEVLQDAFGERSVEALKGALATMAPEDAQYHMKRCVDSGLWDPAGAGGGGDDDDDAPADVSDAGAGSSSADAGPSKKSAEVDD